MSLRFPPYAHFATLVLFASGCSPDSADLPDSSTYSVTDSAGVRIVDNHSPAWDTGEEWTVGTEAVVTIGVADGEPEYQLFGVSDATRLADGRIAIVNSGTKEIRVFDSGGAWVETVGGEGEGPGEFMYPLKIAMAAVDTVLVFDGAYPGSLSRFANTAFVDRTPLNRAALNDAFPNWFAEGGDLLADGSLLLGLHNQETAGQTELGAYRMEIGWARMTADGSRIDTVGFLPGWEHFGYEVEGQKAANPLPFGANSYVVAGGNPVRVFVADSRVYEIRALSDDGAVQTILRREVSPRPVTDEDIRQVEERYRGFLDQVPEDQRGRFLTFLDVVEYPETHTVFGIVEVDLEGNLWVGDMDGGGDGQSMSVFDTTGVWLGHVKLAGNLRIFEIGADYVLGGKRDELGVESVLMYELDRK
ncbi:MAG: 6-bladed beta-propeller [marine benthic group bacterium]|nr:6-bladed beta-propeller [Gemmatimonadota bacterium]